MLKKVEILIPESGDYDGLLGKMNSHDKFSKESMSKLVFKENYHIVSVESYKSSTTTDLIIIEDDFKDYCSIIKAAVSVESIETVVVLTKDIVALKALKKIRINPKIFTLDFQIKKGDHEATFIGVYELIKKKFNDSPIVGISGFESANTQRELTNLLRSKKDSVFQKVDELWSVLPNILRDKIRIFELEKELEALKNKEKRIFIGSSKKSLRIAQSISSTLDNEESFVPFVWDQETFQPSSYPLDDLMAEADRSTYAIFVFHPDDSIMVEDEEHKMVRDNVLIELGLFTGKLGRNNVFFALQKGSKRKFKIPSDLKGLNYLEYGDDYENNLVRAVANLCFKFREQIKKIEQTRW